MTSTERHLLEQLATRGTPRGATSVLDGARSAAEVSYVPSHEDRPSRRRGRRLVLAGVAAAVLVVVVAAVVLRSSEDRPVTPTGRADRNAALAALEQAHQAVASGDDDALCQLSARPEICHSMLGLGLNGFDQRPTAMPTVLDGRALPAVADERSPFPGGYLLDVCGRLPDGSIYVSNFVLLNDGRGVMGELYWTDYHLTDPLGSGAGSWIPTPDVVAACEAAL